MEIKMKTWDLNGFAFPNSERIGHSKLFDIEQKFWIKQEKVSSSTEGTSIRTQSAVNYGPINDKIVKTPSQPLSNPNCSKSHQSLSNLKHDYINRNSDNPIVTIDTNFVENITQFRKKEVRLKCWLVANKPPKKDPDCTKKFKNHSTERLHVCATCGNRTQKCLSCLLQHNEKMNYQPTVDLEHEHLSLKILTAINSKSDIVNTTNQNVNDSKINVENSGGNNKILISCKTENDLTYKQHQSDMERSKKYGTFMGKLTKLGTEQIINPSVAETEFEQTGPLENVKTSSSTSVIKDIETELPLQTIAPAPFAIKTESSSLLFDAQSMSKRSYDCPICPKSYQEFRNLKYHLVRQHLDHPIISSDPNTAITLNSLQKREATRKLSDAKNPKLKKFQCPFSPHCQMTFAYRSFLVRHLKTTHSNLRPHICKNCGSKFKTLDNLQTHMARKICLFSSKATSGQELGRQNNTLEKTLETHNVISILKTKSSFNSNSRRFHSGMWSKHPFNCHLCTYSSHVAHTFWMHVKTHTEELICLTCFKSFEDKLALVQHLRGTCLAAKSINAGS